jgi:hypothetical protein
VGQPGLFKSARVGMIKNLVANGCSYTAENPQYVCWPQQTAEMLTIPHYHNLALGAAGNQYICFSTVEFLETANLDPNNTLVLVMWSGIGRKELLISDEWAEHLRASYNWVPQRNNDISHGKVDMSHYLFSGGQAGSWIENSGVADIFYRLYRVSDEHTLCKESLLAFINLENYLKVHGYHYWFTSFLNLWNDDSLVSDHGEHRIKKENYALSVNFDFSKWAFTDQLKNGFGEFALLHNEMIIDHPSGKAHQKFAKEIIVPLIEKDQK